MLCVSVYVCVKTCVCVCVLSVCVHIVKVCQLCDVCVCAHAPACGVFAWQKEGMG